MSDYASDDYKLRDILAIFGRWRKLALAAFLAVLVPGLAVTVLMPPMYEASALLLVDRPTIAPTYTTRPGQGLESAPVLRSVNREEEVKTVAETIRTRALVETTVAALAIDFASLNRIRDFRRYVQAAIDWVLDTGKWLLAEAKYRSGFSKRPTPEEIAFAEREKLLDAVGDRLRVTSVPDTNVLRASFRASDPSLAQAAINAMVTEFVGRQQGADKASRELFAEELRQVAEELHAKEVALADFRGRMSSYAIATQRDLLLQAEERLRAEIAQAESRRAQKSAAVAALRDRLWADPRFQRDINKSLIDAEVDLAEVTAQLGPLRKALEETRQQLFTINKATVQVRELERDVARSEEALSLRQRNFEQAKLTETMTSAQLRNVKIVDLAAYPLDPVRPRTLLYLGIALGAALLAAIALPFVAHLNDASVASEHEVARLLDLPLVASVPRLRRWVPAVPLLPAPDDGPPGTAPGRQGHAG